MLPPRLDEYGFNPKDCHDNGSKGTGSMLAQTPLQPTAFAFT